MHKANHQTKKDKLRLTTATAAHSSVMQLQKIIAINAHKTCTVENSQKRSKFVHKYILMLCTYCAFVNE